MQFFISHLASWLRTRRFSEPTFRPSGAPNHWKNTVFRDFPTFSRMCIFFLLTLLSSNLSLLSASSLLCFSSVHIVGSLTSKLPSTTSTTLQLHNNNNYYYNYYNYNYNNNYYYNNYCYYISTSTTSTPLQLQLQLQLQLLRYTTLHPGVVSEVTTATIVTTPKNTAPTTFRSISGFALQAVIHNNQPLPIGLLFLKLPPPPCAVLLVCCYTSCKKSHDTFRVYMLLHLL